MWTEEYGDYGPDPEEPPDDDPTVVIDPEDKYSVIEDVITESDQFRQDPTFSCMLISRSHSATPHLNTHF